MTLPLRLLFDECIPKPSVNGLIHYLSTSPNPPDIKTVFDYQVAGIADEIWIPQTAKDNRVIVTADYGRRGKSKPGQPKGEKLPNICTRLLITHIILSSKIHQQNIFEKTQCLLRCWKSIETVPEALPGSRFVMKYTSNGRGVQLVKSELVPESKR